MTRQLIFDVLHATTALSSGNPSSIPIFSQANPSNSSRCVHYNRLQICYDANCTAVQDQSNTTYHWISNETYQVNACKPHKQSTYYLSMVLHTGAQLSQPMHLEICGWQTYQVNQSATLQPFFQKNQSQDVATYSDLMQYFQVVGDNPTQCTFDNYQLCVDAGCTTFLNTTTALGSTSFYMIDGANFTDRGRLKIDKQ